MVQWFIQGILPVQPTGSDTMYCVYVVYMYIIILCLFCLNCSWAVATHDVMSRHVKFTLGPKCRTVILQSIL